MGAFNYINIGQFANDETGDTIRTAFSKINTNYANMTILANVLANVSPDIAATLGNISIPAIPTSLVERDSTGSGFFNNLTVNSNLYTNLLGITDQYNLPIVAGDNGQVISIYANGNGYWKTINGETTPGANSQLLFNLNGSFSATPNINTDGINIIATGNISANNFIGNGSQLSGIYSNANASSYLLTNTGNISANNFIGNLLIVNNGSVLGPPLYTTANSTPIIDLSKSDKHIINLTSNVNISNFIHPSDGREYTFLIQQGTTGNFNWTWPTNTVGGGNINISYNNTTANSYSTQKLMASVSANIFYAISPLITFGV